MVAGVSVHRMCERRKLRGNVVTSKLLRCSSGSNANLITAAGNGDFLE